MDRRNSITATILLGGIAEIQMGYPFRARLEHDPAGNVAVVQMKDIGAANDVETTNITRVQLAARKEHHLLQPGDVLFRSRGQNNNVALVSADIGTAIVAAPLLRIRPRNVLPEYLCWFLNAPTTQAQLRAMAAGTAVRMISAEAIKSLEVSVPSEAIQRRVAEIAALARSERELTARVLEQRHRLTTQLLMQRVQRASRKEDS